MRIWWVLFVVACEKAPPPAEPQPLSNRKPQPAEAPFSSIAGEWRGTGTQFDIGSTWGIVMRLAPNADIGAKVGTIRYPDLGCSGDLVRLEAPQTHELHMREQLTVNPVTQDTQTCIDLGTIIVPVTPRTDGMLDWKWEYPDGKPGATATLTR